MKSLVWVLLLATTLPLTAQEPADTAAALSPNGGGAEAQQLRKQSRQRWNEHVRSTLGQGRYRAAGSESCRGRSERQGQAGQPLLACPWCAQLSALLNCSQRPSSVASPFGVPSASVNPAKIHGLPPTPPSTGCFGKVKFRPAGMTVTLRVTSASCGPPTGLSLLRKMIRADMPAMVTPLVKLKNGPGLF